MIRCDVCGAQAPTTKIKIEGFVNRTRADGIRVSLDRIGDVEDVCSECRASLHDAAEPIRETVQVVEDVIRLQGLLAAIEARRAELRAADRAPE